MDRDATAQLKSSIAYALSRSLPKVPRRGTWGGLAEPEVNRVAQAVVDHLQLCGYRLEPKPPREVGPGGFDHLLLRR